MPEDFDKFSLYFSHSWRPRDVDLNLWVWEQIAGSCQLLVDVPDEAGENPPYYVSRLEELMRRADLFLCVLTVRDEPVEGTGLMCSPYSLFEIRLAERFNIPRLVLYERMTHFRSPRLQGSNEAYIAFDRGPAESLPADRHWHTTVARKIRQWIDWMAETWKPFRYEPSNLAVSLIPDHAPEAAGVRQGLKESLHYAGYESVELQSAFQDNTRLFEVLRAAGLAVVELGLNDPVSTQLNSVAHALCIPAIRMLHGRKELPWLIQGHPGGYEKDIANWSNAVDIPALVQPRARAMFGISHSLDDKEVRRYLESKRYMRSFVFMSHTLKPPHRQLVDKIYQMFKPHNINTFEYHSTNPAGAEWEQELDKQLLKTTLFVSLLTDDYEKSQTCTHELEEILKRGAAVTILPFMVAGRSVPHPKLVHLHHRLLDNPDPQANAEQVVQQVLLKLRSSHESES